VIITGLVLSAAGALGVGAAHGELSLVIAAIALAGGVLAAWPVILSYAAELYPTRIRATAIGWASAAGRTGGILSPALLGVLMSSWTSGRILALSVFAGALVIAALVIVFLGEETAGRPLEEVAEAVSQGAPSGAPPAHRRASGMRPMTSKGAIANRSESVNE
jgi:putative MFS transporter